MNGPEPGRPAELTPAFANHTRCTAEEGVAVRITADGGLTLTPRQSNCVYAGTASTSAWCACPTEAAPGTGAPLTLTRTPARGFSEGPSTVAAGTTVQADPSPAPCGAASATRWRCGSACAPRGPADRRATRIGGASKWSRRKGPRSHPSRVYRRRRARPGAAG